MISFSLPKAWTPLFFHKTQNSLWHCPARTVCAAAGRGSGKTELARRRIVAYLPVKKAWSDPKYFYALPTFAQAKLVAWEQLLALIPKHWLAKSPNLSELYVETVFGSKLYVVGLDKPQRIEGVQWDGGVIDESSDQKPGVFDRSVRPALTHRNGWCWRIGVPKRYGPGAREFKHAYELGMRNEAGIRSFTWPSWDILSEAEIAQLKVQLDTKDFLEQVGGNFVDAGGLAYYQFDKNINVRQCNYDSTRPILVCSDFNVDPMAWVLCHFVDTPFGEGLEVFDEIWLRNTNTMATLDVLYNRYSLHKGGWIFTGDASGRARKTAASSSDYKQIRNDDRFIARVRYEKGNPKVKDRLAAVNVLLKNAAGNARCWIDPKCKHLIDDLENRSLTPDGDPSPAVPNEEHDSGHATDALGYGVVKYFPLLTQKNKGFVVIGR